MVLALVASSKVYPSGGAFAATADAILLPPPGMFSMTNCLSKNCESRSA